LRGVYQLSVSSCARTGRGDGAMTGRRGGSAASGFTCRGGACILAAAFGLAMPPPWKAGVHAVYTYGRCVGARRCVSCRALALSRPSRRILSRPRTQRCLWLFCLAPCTMLELMLIPRAIARGA
jgi:hypothetical protein